MPWPSDPVAVGDLIQASQLNMLPVEITSQTLSASAATVSFTSIPQGYRHLLVTAHARCDGSVTLTNLVARLNNDTGGNYDYQYQTAIGSTVSSGESYGAATAEVGLVTGSSAASNEFAWTELWIPNYASSLSKLIRASAGGKSGTSSGDIELATFSAHWRSTAAVTELGLFPTVSYEFVADSTFALYGIPG